jgi:FkbM family methyltransferase
MVVYDCGAAAGFYTLLAVRLTGKDGHVMAVEPSPRQLRWLRRNLHANHLDEVRVVEAAISDRNGAAGFRESFSAGSGGSLREGGEAQVDVCTLDALAEKCPPDFIKLDVETAEVAALNGARKLLGGRRPLICLACHGGPLFSECAKILMNHKYRHLLIEGRCEYGTTLWTPEA